MITVKYINDVHMAVDASGGIENDLMEYFSFFVPGYKFMPKYKNKMWSGKIHLYTPYTHKMYLGLLNVLVDFAEMLDSEINIDPEVASCFWSNASDKDIENFILGLPITAHGKEIELYEHQLQAITSAIKLNRMTLIAPTSAGKSLITYCLIRYYLHKNTHQNILIIVPSVMLVDQLYSDFEDYAQLDNGFNVEKNCHKIFSGQDKTTTKNITITTWQSVFKLPKQWFSKFNICVNDETHQAKSSSITSIMEKLTECKIKIGMTGTLDGSLCNKLVIAGLFGPVQQFITTTQLMDKGIVAKLKIENIILSYKPLERKECNKNKYPDEIKYIVNHARRNNLVADLAACQTETCLILANNVSHCKNLYKLAQKKAAGRQVYLITGATKKEARNEIRSAADLHKGAIIIGTYGCMATGVSIRNIHSVIFASPTKSIIRTLQSIGRGLRVSESKSKVKLYDIVDDLTYRKRQNYAMKHFVDRLKIYNVQKFDYSINKLEL